MTGPESSDFFEKGWCQFEFDPQLANWIDKTLAAAHRTVTDPVNALWLRHSGTWFVGVNALENDELGAIDGGPPISGHAVNFINDNLKMDVVRWDRAQVSICYPGYPARSGAESEAAFLYRLNRDAAHIDGLRREGPDRRRSLAGPPRRRAADSPMSGCLRSGPAHRPSWRVGPRGSPIPSARRHRNCR